MVDERSDSFINTPRHMILHTVDLIPDSEVTSELTGLTQQQAHAGYTRLQTDIQLSGET